MNKDQNKTEANLFNVLDDNFQAIYSVAKIFLLELKLAAYSLPVYMALIGLIVLLSLSAWLCLIATAITFLMYFGFSPLLSVFSVLMFNIILIILAIVMLKKLRQNFKFNETIKILKGSDDV